jgi:hypothetical protein
VPHLRDGPIVAKVGNFRGRENEKEKGLGGPHLDQPQTWVPHLRDSLIVAKVGHSRKARTVFFRREIIPSARTFNPT